MTRSASMALLALVVAGAPAGAQGPHAGHVHGGAGSEHVAIRLDPAQRQAIGLTYGVVERRPVEKVIRTVGRFDYDERKLAEVTLKVGGWIQDLFADYTGKPVRRGDPLFSLYSPDLFTAEQEYLLALETRSRLADSRVPGARESANSLARVARERLRLWDLDDRQIRALEEARKPELYVKIHSPTEGVVVEKNALRGQAVQPGMTLYKIADLSTIWVYADVYEYELPVVHEGLEARITTAYTPGEAFTARVAYVYPTLDPKTRTGRVRFELANPERQPLRPDMYGDVEMHVDLGERLVVPETAILDSGRRQLAFVDGGDGRLEPREVRLGQRFEGAVEVLEGLAAGERVVTSANFLVDSESRLQAAESMMGMMGALGMGGVKMETARPMEMGGGGGGGPEEKQVGDLRVAVSPAREPTGLGENTLHVRVRDATGAPVVGARVSFTYTMDMPGMAIEEAAARDLGDGVYEGSARFTMGGPWSVVVQVERPGKPPVREKFTLRVAS